MINKDFNSIIELLQVFHNEQTCIDHLEQLRWNGNVVSPFDVSSKLYKCKGNKYRCNNTGRYFNVKTYTLFDNTKMSLQKWFVAIWFVTSHKKGISSIQLAKDIRVTQKTAWFMLQRIRNCFGYDNKSKLNNNVDIDETFVGGKNKNRHKYKKVKNSQGPSFKDKTPVFGMLERNSKVVAKVVLDTKSTTLLPIIHKYINYTAKVYTDDWFYGDIDKYYSREQVNHSIHYYGNGDTHTNTIEGFWSIMKRGIIGIYHFTSRKHLQLYVDEFIFRYNNRNHSENVKFNTLLCNNECRLTYKELTNGN